MLAVYHHDDNKYRELTAFLEAKGVDLEHHIDPEVGSVPALVERIASNIVGVVLFSLEESAQNLAVSSMGLQADRRYFFYNTREENALVNLLERIEGPVFIVMDPMVNLPRNLVGRVTKYSFEDFWEIVHLSQLD